MLEKGFFFSHLHAGTSLADPNRFFSDPDSALAKVHDPDTNISAYVYLRKDMSMNVGVYIHVPYMCIPVPALYAHLYMWKSKPKEEKIPLLEGLFYKFSDKKAQIPIC